MELAVLTRWYHRKFVHFIVCSEVVNHNNERDRTESGALRHTATESLP